MSISEKEQREAICEVGRLMYQKGWVAANDGNITVRLNAEEILCTPTGVSKGMMKPSDLITCDLKGNKISGSRACTSEILMHTTVYALRDDVQAVVHAHPPVATGFAVAGRALNLAILPELIVCLGCIPLTKYALPGTEELPESLKPYIPTYDALLMANHGAVCYGEDLHSAFFKLETVEHVARITLVAKLLGGPKVLPRSEVDRLFEARSRYGVESRAVRSPGCPITAEDLNEDEEHWTLSRTELLSLLQDAVRLKG